MILGWAGVLGHPATVEEADRRFADHVTGKTQIPADLRRSVYQTVAASGGAKARSVTFEFGGHYFQKYAFS